MPYDGTIVSRHPRAIEHAQRAAIRRQVKKDARAFEHELTSQWGLRYVHVRQDKSRITHQMDDYGLVLPKGGVTVAYQLPARKGGRIIKASVAIVNESDSYVKHEGRLRAAAKFHAGERVELRVPRNIPTSAFLKQMFGTML